MLFDDLQQTAYCSKCQKHKSTSEFPVDRGASNGISYRCKECARAQSAEYRKNNSDKIEEYVQKPEVKNRIKEYRKNYYDLEKNPDNYWMYREFSWKRAGILNFDRYTFFEYFTGQCAICKHEITVKEAYVDHDHKTGKFRGIICRGCNTGLSNFRDSAEILENAANYLAQHE